MRTFSAAAIMCLALSLGELHAQYEQLSIADLPGVNRGDRISLVDGSETQFWVGASGSRVKNWVVENGELFRKSNGGNLFARNTYKDFEFAFEFKIPKGANSGVKYRVRDYNGTQLGCEFQIVDDSIAAKRRYMTAGLYDVYRPNKTAKSVIGEWNSAKVVVIGNRIEHWLNGTLAVDATIGSGLWYWNISQSKFKHRDSFGQNLEGKIFLQDHGTPVRFRNLALTPLKK